MINRTIEHYRVIARLGEGGMGEVWRAEDVRLGRQVALKILGGHLANDTVALGRFEDEARLAGSINHPHIISVYDVGAVDERPFIAMELVDGEPLDAVLASGRLRIDDVVTWALQIADALSAAHRAGILHRDVKPANIYVSGRGYAKLGDFGIAKLRERASDPALTVTSSLTGAAIVGSPSYLSPEQARAEPLDGRSDIFSFAATLYEMLTGRRAFAGPSPADVVAAVLREEPEPVSRLRPDVPPALEAIVTKGLEKRPEYRYQHMDEVVADLRRIKRDLETGRIAAGAPAAPTSPDARRGTSASSLVAAFAAGALVAGGFTWWWAASRPDEDARLRSEYELARLTSNPGLEYEPAWSPDGRSVAYTSNEGGHLGIWIRQVPGERAVRVSAPDVDEGRPVWSPDGTQLAFVSSRNRGGRFGIFLGARPIEIYTAGQDGDLFVMPALGGTARQLAEDAYDPSWSPDGRRLAFRSIRDGAWRLYTVALDTGAITPVAGVAPRALAPSWSPDGRWIAYVGGASAATGWDLYVVRAGGGTPIQLTSDQTTIALSPSWSPDGRSITYSSNRAGPLNLWRVGFDAGRATATGPPARLTTGIGEDVDASVAPDGLRIAFASVHTAPNVWMIDVASRQLRQLTFETTIEDYPRLSPDGERLLFYSDRTGAEESG